MTFGYFKGARVAIIHHRRNEEGQVGMPLLCRLRWPPPQHYLSFLSRTVEKGFQSLDLWLEFDHVRDIWTRRRHRRANPMLKAIVTFQRLYRMRIESRIRQQQRCALIKESLIALAFHPDRIASWIEMGLSSEQIYQM